MGSGSSAKKYKGEKPDAVAKAETAPPAGAHHTASEMVVEPVAELVDEPPTPPPSSEGRRSPRPEAAPVETSPRLAAARIEGHAETRLESVAEQPQSEAPNVDRNEELDERSPSKTPSDPEPQRTLSAAVVTVAPVRSPKEQRRGLTQELQLQLPQSTQLPQSSQLPQSHAAKKRMSMPAMSVPADFDAARSNNDAQESAVPKTRGHRHSEMLPSTFSGGYGGRQSLDPLPQRRGSKRNEPLELMPERRGSKRNNSHPERRGSKQNQLAVPEEHEASQWNDVRHSMMDHDREADLHIGESAHELLQHEVHHRRPSRASFMHHRSSVSESADTSLSRRGSKAPTEERTLSKRSSVLGVPGDSRRGSKMTAESGDSSRRGSKMAVSDSENPPLQVGDKVTTADGPDADGPWRDMGNGIVEALGKHPGTVVVKFESTGAVFEIKEKNLLELKVKDEKDKRRKSKEAKYEVKIDGMIGDPYMGIKVGDTVAFSNGGRGLVVKEGVTPGTVLVRFAELGIRSVPCNQVTKMRVVDGEDQEDAAWKARFMDSSAKKSYQLTLDEAMSTFHEQYDLEKAMLEREKQTADPNDPLKGLRPGDYVMVNDHGPWHELGVGLIKGPGQHVGTAMVQFDCVGDTWALKVDMLTKVAKLDVNWKKTRAFDHKPKHRDKKGSKNAVDTSVEVGAGTAS